MDDLTITDQKDVPAPERRPFLGEAPDTYNFGCSGKGAKGSKKER